MSPRTNMVAGSALFALTVALIFPHHAPRTSENGYWRAIDGNVEFHEARRYRLESCALKLHNVAKRPLTFLAFKIRYPDAHSHQYIERAQTLQRTIAPDDDWGAWEWNVDAADCDAITISITSAVYG